MRRTLLAGRTATAGLVALLTLATLVAARAPVAASDAGPPPATSDNVILRWNQAALQAVRDTRPPPTVAARALAVVHAGIYDAWAAYDARAAGTRMGGALRRRPAERTLANKNAAISHAAYRALADLFPARRDAFDADRWQPLRLPSGAVQAFATPHWYRVTPFALRSAAQFRPDGPTAHVDAQGRPNQAYLRQVRETLRDSRQLDDRSKSIAAYWWDGPSTELPPGHWCLLAQYVSRRDHHSVDQDAKMFLALTGALLDASIAAWGGPGRGTRPIRGEDWLPYQPAAVVTPPFAEYVSGHSTFSAAAAEVLASFTGSRRFGLSVTIPAGSSMLEPGVVPTRPVTLTFPTFAAAADQAGRSRRYGGIHFEAGDLDGRALGGRVGANAWARASGYFDGTAAP